MILDPEVKRLVKSWFEKAKTERDVFSKFIFLYFCLNAIAANLSEEDYDRSMLNWLYTNENRIKARYIQLLSNNYFRQRLETLKGYCPVASNRPGKPPAMITTIENFAEVVETIYQIRCNLFHGQKSPSRIRDQKLVSVSGKILHKLIGGIL